MRHADEACSQDNEVMGLQSFVTGSHADVGARVAEDGDEQPVVEMTPFADPSAAVKDGRGDAAQRAVDRGVDPAGAPFAQR